MKKLIKLFALLIAAAALFTACGAKDEGGGDGINVNTSTTIKEPSGLTSSDMSKEDVMEATIGKPGKWNLFMVFKGDGEITLLDVGDSSSDDPDSGVISMGGMMDGMTYSIEGNSIADFTVADDQEGTITILSQSIYSKMIMEYEMDPEFAALMQMYGGMSSQTETTKDPETGLTTKFVINGTKMTTTTWGKLSDASIAEMNEDDNSFASLFKDIGDDATIKVNDDYTVYYITCTGLRETNTEDTGDVDMDVLYPLLVCVAYFALGFGFHWWHTAWIIFLTIPVYYILFPAKY